MPPMTAKQIRFFGTKAQKAALRRKRSSNSTPRPAKRGRRVSRRHNNMPRRKSSKRGRRGGRSKASWSEAAATANIAIQAAEPFLPAAQAAMAGDFQGAVNAAKPALKEAASFKNIGQAMGPLVAQKVAKKVLGALRIRAPKVAGRRLW